ncbi:MAG: hypothetical protein EOM08_05860 [Clostridia bacterium]|nr:hypothetical protein [Clostridia bacterium]
MMYPSCRYSSILTNFTSLFDITRTSLYRKNEGDEAMKRVLTVVLISILILAVTAFVTIMIAISGFRYLLPNVAPVRLVDRQYESANEPLSELRIILRNRSANIRMDQGTTIRLDWNETEYEPVQIQEQDGRLSVEEGERTTWRARFDWLWGFALRPMTVTIPATFKGRIDLVTSNGPVTLDSLDLAGPVNVRTTNGGITVQNLAVTAGLELATSNGAITAQDITADSAYLVTSNGRIEVSQLLAKDLSLKTSNGPINCAAITGDTIRLETSNGNIRGTVQGRAKDYSITSQTSNGENSLEDVSGQGAKTLTVKTSNGNIEIQFTGETQSAGNLLSVTWLMKAGLVR